MSRWIIWLFNDCKVLVEDFRVHFFPLDIPKKTPLNNEPHGRQEI